MKKFFLIVVCLLFVLCGCDSMMNTPTKKVEEFLNKYQMQDDEILSQLDNIIENGEYVFNQEQKNAYSTLMKKQYKDLTYTIKEEMIDGNSAVVTVEIEVYDYNKEIKNAEEHYKLNPNEFKTTDGQLDNSKYMDYRIKLLENTKDRIKYTLNLSLKKKKKKWILNNITESDRQKIHGLYNS